VSRETCSKELVQYLQRWNSTITAFVKQWRVG
jgi:hypothetical protein